MDTMRIVGKIQLHTVVILIDSESTHNFLSQTCRGEKPSEIDEKVKLSLEVASGYKMRSLGLCKALKVEIQEQCFLVNFHVIPLNDYDVVIGENDSKRLVWCGGILKKDY